MIETIGFDADDTLWHNEILYLRAQEAFQELLVPYAPPGKALDELHRTELQNIPLYGYGIKGFALSMIETAIRLSDGRTTAAETARILDIAKEMLRAPVQLLDGVREVLAALAPDYELVMITKGDLLDQELKVARSGLGPFFRNIEVVPEKNPEIYLEILDRLRIPPQRFLMVGNSLRSDILPLVSLGAHAVHIPYDITWEHEAVELGTGQAAGYAELEQIGLLPGFVQELSMQLGGKDGS
jgi:putative hydrolase of the HAD superfamily